MTEWDKLIQHFPITSTGHRSSPCLNTQCVHASSGWVPHLVAAAIPLHRFTPSTVNVPSQRVDELRGWASHVALLWAGALAGPPSNDRSRHAMMRPTPCGRRLRTPATVNRIIDQGKLGRCTPSTLTQSRGSHEKKP